MSGGETLLEYYIRKRNSRSTNGLILTEEGNNNIPHEIRSLIAKKGDSLCKIIDMLLKDGFTPSKKNEIGFFLRAICSYAIERGRSDVEIAIRSLWKLYTDCDLCVKYTDYRKTKKAGSDALSLKVHLLEWVLLSLREN